MIYYVCDMCKCKQKDGNKVYAATIEREGKTIKFDICERCLGQINLLQFDYTEWAGTMKTIMRNERIKCREVAEHIGCVVSNVTTALNSQANVKTKTERLQRVENAINELSELRRDKKERNGRK